MKYLRTFESFDQPLQMTGDYPSKDNMKAYVCGFGSYTEMECDEMSYDQLCSAYDTCKMEMNEAKKTKKMSYKKSGLKNPHLADLNKDGEISGYEKARGKAIQKSVQSRKESKKIARK